jgi:hypothetical protein
MDRLDVRGATWRVGEEVEHRAIVPEVDARFVEERGRRVTDDPTHARRRVPEPRARMLERLRGDVGDGHPLEPSGEEIVDERRSAAPHVDDVRARVEPAAVDPRERPLEAWPVPAHRVG